MNATTLTLWDLGLGLVLAWTIGECGRLYRRAQRRREAAVLYPFARGVS